MQENKDARARKDSQSGLPFFARFLEGQHREGIGIQTLKFPSDRDEGDQTMKYPSDNDESEDSHSFAG